MPAPVDISIPINTWTLVASNSKGGMIFRRLSNQYYRIAYREPGAAAPTDNNDGDYIFQNSDQEKILETVGMDIYIYISYKSGSVTVISTPTFGDIFVQDQYTDSVDIYAHIDAAIPAITINTNIDDTSITVDSIAGINPEDAIIILENERFLQSIVLSAAGNIINLASPLDYAFTTAAIVHVGPWNLNVNGSVTPVISHVIVPPTAKVDIYQINVAMTDNVAMDSQKFGGIPALTNGILFRIVNNTIKNLPLVVNNIGFSEQGFCIDYDPKAPAGVYGFQAKKNYPEINGVSLRLNGETNDELQCIINDDLTALISFNITINGHIVEDR